MICVLTIQGKRGDMTKTSEEDHEEDQKSSKKTRKKMKITKEDITSTTSVSDVAPPPFPSGWRRPGSSFIPKKMFPPTKHPHLTDYFPRTNTPKHIHTQSPTSSINAPTPKLSIKTSSIKTLPIGKQEEQPDEQKDEHVRSLTTASSHSHPTAEHPTNYKRPGLTASTAAALASSPTSASTRVAAAATSAAAAAAATHTATSAAAATATSAADSFGAVCADAVGNEPAKHNNAFEEESENYKPQFFYQDKETRSVRIPTSYVLPETECMMCGTSPPVKACVLLPESYPFINGKCKHVYCMSCLDQLISHRPTRGARNIKGKDYTVNYPWLFKMMVDAWEEGNQTKMCCAWSEMMSNEHNFIFEMYERHDPLKRRTEHVCMRCLNVPINYFQEIDTGIVYRLPHYPTAYVGAQPVWTYTEWAHAEVLAKVWQDVICNQESFEELVGHMKWFTEQKEKGGAMEIFDPLKYAFNYRQM